MDDKELRVELETRLGKLVKNFAGQQIDQKFITSIWAATQDEVKNFNDEFMKLSASAVDWLHSQYVNRFINMKNTDGQSVTIGELTNHENPPTLTKVPLIELIRMKKVFENTALEMDIVAEIKDRLNNNGKTDKQASRGSVSTDN